MFAPPTSMASLSLASVTSALTSSLPASCTAAATVVVSVVRSFAAAASCCWAVP